MSFDKIVAHSLTLCGDTRFVRIKNMKPQYVGSLYLDNIVVRSELK